MRVRRLRVRVGAALLAVGRVASPLCLAEFYAWIDARGQARVSNIPSRGVRADGSIDPRFNPTSIVGQQAALGARLKAREAALAATREAAQSALDVPAVGAASN